MTAENIINKYYKTHFETSDWDGELKQYALRFKEMYDRELQNLRNLKLPQKNEIELAKIAIHNVDYYYKEAMENFKEVLDNLEKKT